MTPAYPAPVPGYFNIGVLHTSLSGHGQHETYAPCTPETLRPRITITGRWAMYMSA